MVIRIELVGVPDNSLKITHPSKVEFPGVAYMYHTCIPYSTNDKFMLELRAPGPWEMFYGRWLDVNVLLYFVINLDGRAGSGCGVMPDVIGFSKAKR